MQMGGWEGEVSPGGAGDPRDPLRAGSRDGVLKNQPRTPLSLGVSSIRVTWNFLWIFLIDQIVLIIDILRMDPKWNRQACAWLIRKAYEHRLLSRLFCRIRNGFISAPSSWCSKKLSWVFMRNHFIISSHLCNLKLSLIVSVILRIHRLLIDLIW